MGKNKGGRPTKYTEELLEKAEKYIDSFEDYEHAFPSHIGLAEVLDISTETLYQWEKDPEKKVFSDMLGKIKQKQHNIAWSRGMTGEYNANLVKLLLTKHGYSDKNEHELYGKGGGPIQQEHGISESDRDILNRWKKGESKE